VSAVAFFYRPRKGGEPTAAVVGESVSILENIEYVIEFANAPRAADIARMSEIGYEAITSKTGVLCFRNHVGTSNIAGVSLHVVSTKLGDDGVSRLLEDVSVVSASLVFGWRTPTGHHATASRTSRAPIPYHQLQFLRQVVLRNAVGTRMQDYLHSIELNPTRRFVVERPLVGIERARRLDERSIREIFTRTERLAALPAASDLNANAIATALEFGNPTRRHFPVLVSEASRKFSYDTVENRFTKYFVEQCLAVVYKLLDNKAIHQQMRMDCRAMATILETAANARYLAEVKALSALPSPTQVMLKSEGYKELWQLWQEFGAFMSLPTDEGDLQRLLQGRDVAQLYEYWVFLKVLEATLGALDGEAKVAVSVTMGDLGATFDRGLSVKVNDEIRVSFNPSFTRSHGNAYSTPLRPDVVLELGNKKYVFDAKYRLKWKELQDETADDDSTFLRADLYKMHTYRDAIRNVEAAFVVYPGSEFGFYESSGTLSLAVGTVLQFNGVGAIPARPDASASPSVLSLLIRRLLVLP
jgi:predicted component of viral defense system (DUF524 family)